MKSLIFTFLLLIQPIFSNTDYFFIDTLNDYNPNKPSNIDDVLEIDKLARFKALDFIKRKY